MTDNATLMVDLSSNQPLPNLKTHYAAGYRTLALKATEGTTYAWDQHGALADQWHRLGGQVWHYHFARPGQGAQQVAAFLAAINGHWKPGDRVALDVEVAGVDASFVALFINAVHKAHPDWPGVVYSYASFLEQANIRPVHGWGLWLADYSATSCPKPPPGWDQVTAWQYTDRATVPGVNAPVDQSHLYTAQKVTALATATAVAAKLVVRNLSGRNQPTDQAGNALLDQVIEQATRVRRLSP